MHVVYEVLERLLGLSQFVVQECMVIQNFCMALLEVIFPHNSGAVD